MFYKFSLNQHPRGACLNVEQIPESCPQSVQLSLSEVGCQNLRSSKFQSDVKAAGMEFTPWEQLSWLSALATYQNCPSNF